MTLDEMRAKAEAWHHADRFSTVFTPARVLALLAVVEAAQAVQDAEPGSEDWIALEEALAALEKMP